MCSLQRFYFETSALNEFQSRYSIQDAIATKVLQNTKGRGFYISPVVLWEILLTSDETKRESLIHFSQHLFEPDLLPSPEELIIRYIKSGFPTVEPEYPLVSTGLFAVAWRDICEIKGKTLKFDSSIVEKTSILRKISRLLHEFNKSNTINIPAADLQVSVQQILDEYALIPTNYSDDIEMIRHFRLVTFFIILIMCAGISIEGDLINKFWEQQGIYSIQERIEITFSRFPQLLFRGPFNHIAYMTHYQSVGKFPRGVYFDSMHTVYSIYADHLLTADKHFCTFRENLKDLFPYVCNIHHLDEIKFFSDSP